MGGSDGVERRRKYEAAGRIKKGWNAKLVLGFLPYCILLLSVAKRKYSTSIVTSRAVRMCSSEHS